ncbi:MAG: (2Fe-2S)-binding protein [Spirochaetia bacterium]|jgi:carbon-monoxide dehydrogenase small subunit|uniref:Xanthine dehydrogenase iron-sulfur-binding subunit n=1 Tax=uncultured spirochete TaxID=156406 RepID=A0A3P3XH35_9SPIR|nr:(2Fe-2S)-binding protein [Rectinema subterraneum]MDQ7797044.1 (2Fe-2S)-binding protein [Spirochaetia bacterium]SLM11428.1 Xanthine dehydrogenase iron-sulfur-binding subunit [uncultured spirochete]HBE46861.1 (2Fe-2S)-binding protein [Spirochaetaceae bacterium]HCX95603.1 (2Fe-2S)-binding protein [Spirochaetaceae bacterium]
MIITLYINGKKESVECQPGEMLTEVLRRAGYVEVKKGCDTGNCGVCTVLLEGKPVLSCSYLAIRADGKQITTIQGAAKEAEEFAHFLTAEGADQCGFCAPGFALTVLAMKKELPNPSEGEIRHYLAGNLCRCSGYEGQIRAIKKYLEAEHA